MDLGPGFSLRPRPWFQSSCLRTLREGLMPSERSPGHVLLITIITDPLLVCVFRNVMFGHGFLAFERLFAPNSRTLEAFFVNFSFLWVAI